MHLRTITWLLLLSLNVAFGEQKQDNIGWQPWSDAVFAQAKKELLTHFLFRPLCNQLLKRVVNRFRISGIWLEAHFEIIEDRLLVGFRRGGCLELKVPHHDLLAPDLR